MIKLIQEYTLSYNKPHNTKDIVCYLKFTILRYLINSYILFVNHNIIDHLLDNDLISKQERTNHYSFVVYLSIHTYINKYLNTYIHMLKLKYGSFIENPPGNLKNKSEENIQYIIQSPSIKLQNQIPLHLVSSLSITFFIIHPNSMSPSITTLIINSLYAKYK